MWRGFIELDPSTRLFRLGFRLWEVAQSYAMTDDLVSLAQPLMDQLTTTTTETVQLARLEGLDNVYLAISESPHPMKLVSSVGKRLPAHATGLGKALLAGLDDDELARRLSGVTLARFTERTITDQNPTGRAEAGALQGVWVRQRGICHRVQVRRRARARHRRSRHCCHVCFRPHAPVQPGSRPADQDSSEGNREKPRDPHERSSPAPDRGARSRSRRIPVMATNVAPRSSHLPALFEEFQQPELNQ